MTKSGTTTLDSFKTGTELEQRDTIGPSEGVERTIAWAKRFEAKLPDLPTQSVQKP